MRANLHIYRRLVGARIRSEMQYRVSFYAQLAGSFLVIVLDFIAVVLLLARFRLIGGWSLAEVAFLYGTSAVSLGLAELLAGGFGEADRLILRGEFDRVLLRPLASELQLIGERFAVRVIGRALQGALALGAALWLLRPAWGPGQWLFLALTIAGGTLLYLAVLIAGAATAFWSPQTGEIVNIFTNGGQFMTSYPMHIYEEWMRRFFTFVLPLAFINYFPALYLLGKPDPFGAPGWLPFLAPAVAVAALAAALVFWHRGISHYQSTGS